AAFASRTQDEWSEVFARADCCVSPILTVDEALENEQLRARGMAIVREGLTQLAPPVKVSEFEFAIVRPSPGSGEHTDELLREAGFRDAEIDALRRNAVIGRCWRCRLSRPSESSLRCCFSVPALHSRKPRKRSSTRLM